VLVTDQCGLNEIEEVGGGAVCAADVDSIAASLEKLFSAADLEEKGQKWRQYVLENYTWTRIAAQFVRYIEKPL
jgi:glycosyltransferase involved in cell wall biosynthesis